jgi:predicted aminopeptidase
MIKMFRLTLVCCIAFSSLTLSACNPFFVARAAFEQSKILAARRPIQEVIQDPSTKNEQKLKLQLVEKAREFSKTLGLNPGGSFTSYTQLTRHPVSWVVSASRKDRFEAYTWWFPIVGSVPYKGYFEKEDADNLSLELQKDGYETWVRGTAAFSTLGWFDDPLLSSTLELPVVDLVNTVIHENVHSTIWIPGSVAFNESLANYVGSRAVIDFFRSLAQSQDDLLTDEQATIFREQAELEFERELEISDLTMHLYSSLERLYADPSLSSEQKIAGREELLTQEFAALRAKYPGLKLFGSVNNAEIMQRKLYLTELRKFDALFLKSEARWNTFFERIEKIKENPGNSEIETFALLSSSM